MVIDENNKYVLTNYKTIKQTGKAVDSDHKTEYMDLDFKVIREKPIRREIFHFKDQLGQAKFKTLTSETQEFTKCFENDFPLEKQIELWQKVLKKTCIKAFKKIRVTGRKKTKPINQELTRLINHRNKLPRNKDVNDIKDIEKRISDIEAKENRDLIFKNFQSFNENPEAVNMAQIWKLMKTLWPKHGNILPVAKQNHLGKVISGPNELKTLLAKEYKDRLRNRPLRPDFEHFKALKSEIFQMKLKNAESKTTLPWKMSQLESALSHLKNNKSRDPEGYINEIFKSELAGRNLKESLLLLCNKLKQGKLISNFMKVANITTVPKKGSRLLLTNERGIFRVSVIRSILMRLIYDSKYPEIDANMSDSQMGGRKGKGCRNNIFILNGIIHEQ